MKTKNERAVAASQASDAPEFAEVDGGLAFAETRGEREVSGRNRTSRMGAFGFSLMLFLVAFLISFFVAKIFTKIWIAFIIATIFALLCILSIHMTLQWEKAVVLRLGRLNRIVGPGIYFTIPIIEYTTLCVDQRMRCTFFAGEQILTADLVPVNVDAVFFWTVYDARKASTEVENFPYSVSCTAQTCMRDVIGSMEIEELATRRRQIDIEIRDEIAMVTEPWGISVPNVKIRNIIVPKNLQDALSKAAQAQRERDSRVILAEVEKDLSEMLVDAANTYDQNPRALQLRAMHIVGDSVKDNGGMVVVPSSLGDGFVKPDDFFKHL